MIWVGTYFQVGLEAIIPVNRESGTGIGFLGQLHLYLDDMFPDTFGKPLLGGTPATAKALLKESTMRSSFLLPSHCSRRSCPRPHAPTHFWTTQAHWSAARSQRAPHEVALSFTQKLEPAFSSRTSDGSKGARVGGKAQISGNTMRVGIKGAGPGATGALACALGRHPQDARKLHLHGRRPMMSAGGHGAEGMA